MSIFTLSRISPFALLIWTMALLFTVSGCFKEPTDEELLQRDRAELVEMLNTNKVLSYKFLKLCLRATLPEKGDSPETSAFKDKADPISRRFIFFDSTAMADPGIGDFIQIYRDYLTLKNFVTSTDEDVFPPLLYQYLRSSRPTDGDGKAFEEELLVIQNVEHAALSVIVLLSKDFGKEIALYECAETDADILPESEEKTLLRLLRGFIFFEKGLYYLSEHELSGNLKWLDAHPDVSLPYSSILFNWRGAQQNQPHTGLHAMNLLFRGFDRLMMDRDIDGERALQDLEAFLQDAEKMGLDNELTWTVAAYVYMKREDHDKAIAALTKLRGSALLGENEKESIDETIGYLRERETGKALNGVFDNVFMCKIAIRYTVALLSDIDWRKLMQENDIPGSDAVFATVDRLEAVIQGIDRYTSVETLVELEKDAEKKVVEEGKGLIKKVEEWWE